MPESLVGLLSSKLGIPPDDNLKESVEYILSITDHNDLREWLEDGMGLTNESDLGEILALVDSIKQMPKIHSNSEIKKVFLDSQGPKPVNQNTSETPQTPQSVFPPPRLLPPVPESTKVTRSMCGCMAKSEYSGGHRVIGNCLQCGRIVCANEDFGDCLFCGEPKTGLMYWIGYKVSDRINSPGKSFEAVEQKNRLIQYDREGTQRTRIYDDSTDWFAETQDVWKGKEEREEAKRMMEEFEEKKSEARRQMKISLDFNTCSISVLDKEKEIHKVETQKDEQLQQFISSATKRENTGNVLNEDQEKILRDIRQKLGVKEKQETEKEYKSLFSIFED
jgi:hypothetical protein